MGISSFATTEFDQLISKLKKTKSCTPLVINVAIIQENTNSVTFIEKKAGIGKTVLIINIYRERELLKALISPSFIYGKLSFRGSTSFHPT